MEMLINIIIFRFTNVYKTYNIQPKLSQNLQQHIRQPVFQENFNLSDTARREIIFPLFWPQFIALITGFREMVDVSCLHFSWINFLNGG